MRRQGTIDPWYNNRQGQSQSSQQIIQNTSHQHRKNNYTQHIKPTTITAANFLHYQANKHTKTDLLDAILDHVLRHPSIPTDRTVTLERSNINNMPYEHKDTNSIQDIKGKQTEAEYSNTISDNEHKNDGENIVRTRYRRIVKKTIQTHV